MNACNRLALKMSPWITFPDYKCALRHVHRRAMVNRKAMKHMIIKKQNATAVNNEIEIGCQIIVDRLDD